MHCQLDKHSKIRIVPSTKHNIYDICHFKTKERCVNNSLVGVGVGVGTGVTHCSSLFPVTETNVK